MKSNRVLKIILLLLITVGWTLSNVLTVFADENEENISVTNSTVTHEFKNEWNDSFKFVLIFSVKDGERRIRVEQWNVKNQTYEKTTLRITDDNKDYVSNKVDTYAFRFSKEFINEMFLPKTLDGVSGYVLAEDDLVLMQYERLGNNHATVYTDKHISELVIGASYKLSYGTETRRDRSDSTLITPEETGPNYNWAEGLVEVEATCETVLAGTFMIMLKDILNIMRIVAIGLVLVFTTIDFVSGLISQDNDAMKKATSKVGTRLIIAIAMFFLPMILNILLGWTGLGIEVCI